MQSLERAGLPGIELPNATSLAGVFHGRSPKQGYERGWGLEFGDLRAHVSAHPLFQEALGLAAGRTVMSPDRLMNIFLIVGCYFDRLAAHNIVEFGSYRGGSLLFMGKLLQHLYPDAKVYGYDTFAGMPETDPEMDAHNKGQFGDTSVEEISDAISQAGLSNIVLNAGMVEDTFPAQSPVGEIYALAHIDLDIYHPIRYVQKAVQPLMTPGGYVVYDDATVSSCIGATQAVEEFVHETGARSEQIFPHFVFRAGLS